MSSGVTAREWKPPAGAWTGSPSAEQRDLGPECTSPCPRVSVQGRATLGDDAWGVRERGTSCDQ